MGYASVTHVEAVLKATATLVRAARATEDEHESDAFGLEHLGTLPADFERALLAHDEANAPAGMLWTPLVDAARAILAREIEVRSEQVRTLQAWLEHADGQALGE